jgi:ribose-phosphate pyrophosphokinase
MLMEMTTPERENIIKPTHDIKIFSGRSNPDLTEDIAKYLGTSVGPMIIKNFADGEIYVKVQESIRGDDVFVVQPLCKPVNENLMELLIIIDAFKRASAKSITAVIPYYGYARQDRKTSGREAITAKLVADLLTTSGANRVLAMDLHTGQIQGYFNILVDHLYSTPIIIDYLKKKNFPENEIVIVSPDAGGVERTRHLAKRLSCPIAIIDKRREAHNVATVEYVIGDVKNKTAILFDDIIDTAGSITEGAKLLIKEGAKKVYVCAAHPVFSGPALQRLEDSPIEEVIVTNSIPLNMDDIPKKITQLNVAPLLGEAITRIHDDESVSSLFE